MADTDEHAEGLHGLEKGPKGVYSHVSCLPVCVTGARLAIDALHLAEFDDPNIDLAEAMVGMLGA